MNMDGTMKQKLTEFLFKTTFLASYDSKKYF